MKRLIGLSLAALLVLPVSLFGQAPGARTHDGLFLRFLVGGGAGSVTMDDVDGSELTFSSASAGAFHFQIGAAVRENLILFGDIGGFSLIEPDVEWAGSTAAGENVDVTVTGLGGGLSYYIMPANVYLSGSILMSTSYITFQDTEGESEFGPSIFLAAGKEWWVGDKWGLGVALVAELGSMDDQPDDTGNQIGISTRTIGIAFTATMN